MALQALACCFSTLKECVPDVFNVLCSDKQKTVLRPGFPGAGSQSPERLSSGLQSAVWLRKSQASLYSYCGLFIDYFHQQEQEAQSLTAENWGTMGRWAAPWWGPCGLWDGGGRLHGSVWGWTPQLQTHAAYYRWWTRGREDSLSPATQRQSTDT